MKKDLMRMGYREAASGKWGKPIGYMLFIFEVSNLTITSFFLGKDGKIYDYDHHVYEPSETVENDFLGFLKYCECSMRTDVNAVNDSQFEFLTQEQIISLSL